jgi:hypothetical protein
MNQGCARSLGNGGQTPVNGPRKRSRRPRLPGALTPSACAPAGSLTYGYAADAGSLTAPLLPRHVSYPQEAHHAAPGASPNLPPAWAPGHPPSPPAHYAPPIAPDIAAGVPIAEESPSPRAAGGTPTTATAAAAAGAVALTVAGGAVEAASLADEDGGENALRKGRGSGTLDAVVYGVINAIVGVPCMIAFAAVIFSVGRGRGTTLRGWRLRGRARVVAPRVFRGALGGAATCVPPSFPAAFLLPNHAPSWRYPLLRDGPCPPPYAPPPLQDPTYKPMLGELARFSFLAAAVHQVSTLCQLAAGGPRAASPALGAAGGACGGR